MRLDFVEIAGFRSFRDKLRINFGAGFTVLTGRNGVGKSTIIDAIDFALTGSINKFKVQSAKGGGLAEHIWWVGEGQPSEHFVRLGVVDESGKRYTSTRFKDGSLKEDAPFADLLISASAGQPITLNKLAATTILRDELISELSLDLTERERFAAVLESISPITGPDLSDKVRDVTSLASGRVAAAQEQLVALQARLAQVLEELAEARNKASQAVGTDAALTLLRESIPTLSDDQEARRQQVAEAIADLRFKTAMVADLRPQVEAIEQETQAILSDGIILSAAALDVELTKQQQLIDELEAAEQSALVTLVEAEEANEKLAHLALLVEHGEAYGLEEGHCPLCAALRTEPEFKAAIEASRQRLADAGSRVAEANAALTELQQRLRAAKQQLLTNQQRRTGFVARIRDAETRKASVANLLAEQGYSDDPADLSAINRWLLNGQERQVRLQEALVALDSSDISDRLGTLERTADQLRAEIDSLSGQISARELVAELAKKVESLTKAFPNQILAEQFDAVMPLLKEFYRRLRPHTDWDEIDYDFGGRIRATLNFYVGDGKNPQFLFSSGQRRATGLAFLLAVHLARHWATLRTLVLDDPVQHIDDYRALNLVEVLAAIRRTGQQIIVAVEDGSLAQLLARRLRGSQDEAGIFYELGTSPTGSTCITRDYPLPSLPVSALAHAQAS